jgi:hypothetical protein
MWKYSYIHGKQFGASWKLIATCSQATFLVHESWPNQFIWVAEKLQHITQLALWMLDSCPPSKNTHTSTLASCMQVRKRELMYVQKLTLWVSTVRLADSISCISGVTGIQDLKYAGGPNRTVEYGQEASSLWDMASAHEVELLRGQDTGLSIAVWNLGGRSWERLEQKSTKSTKQKSQLALENAARRRGSSKLNQMPKSSSSLPPHPCLLPSWGCGGSGGCIYESSLGLRY